MQEDGCESAAFNKFISLESFDTCRQCAVNSKDGATLGER